MQNGEKIPAEERESQRDLWGPIKYHKFAEVWAGRALSEATPAFPC